MKRKKPLTVQQKEDLDYDPKEDRRTYGEDPYENEVYPGKAKDDK